MSLRCMLRVFATASLLASMAAGAEGPERDPFGKVRIVEPTGTIRGFVVLYSDAKGWDQNAEQSAQALGRDGALVVGVDLIQYRLRIDQGARKCGALVGDAEATSRDLQRARNYRDYHSPILAGIGIGGALAEAVLSAAPPATLAGAVSLDPRAPRTPLCGATPANGKPLPGFWTVGGKSAADGLADRIAAAGSAVDVQRVPAKESLSVALADLVSRHLDPATPPTGVAKLPLIELPASAPSPLLAIIVSGDGGWRDLDKVIAEDLNRQGVSVIGWDSLRYFWTRKSPEEAAGDLAAVIETYATRWHAQKIALIGYSFGADVLPFLYNRLPRDDRHRVALISLLALSQAADFEIKVNGWLGGDASDAALPTHAALAPIDPGLIQCFYGEKEESSQCPALAARGAETIHTAGGHHFDGNYAALAQRILTGFKARAQLH